MDVTDMTTVGSGMGWVICRSIGLKNARHLVVFWKLRRLRWWLRWWLRWRLWRRLWWLRGSAAGSSEGVHDSERKLRGERVLDVGR